MKLYDPTDRSRFDGMPDAALIADTEQMVAGVTTGAHPVYHTREAIAGMWEVIRRQQAQITALAKEQGATVGTGTGSVSKTLRYTREDTTTAQLLAKVEGRSLNDYLGESYHTALIGALEDTKRLAEVIRRQDARIAALEAARAPQEGKQP